MNILLLEDESLLNDSITDYLETLGHVVASFKDGEEAIKEISKSYDLLILDINVPNITGFEYLRA